MVARKFEMRKSEHTRRVVKPFKVPHCPFQNLQATNRMNCSADSQGSSCYRPDPEMLVFVHVQVVYEWGLDTATAITAAVRKKQVVSPAASPRIAMTMQSPIKPPSMGLQRSNSGFSLNKLIKGRAP